jgi:predicted RNA-binding Zn-ribbon protein involved in translation (DUF1610 family)
MAEITHEWTCPKCGKEWIDIISFEVTGPDETATGSVSITCPDCGHDSSLMGNPGQRIVAVRTVPKSPSDNR